MSPLLSSPALHQAGRVRGITILAARLWGLSEEELREIQARLQELKG